SIISPVPSPRPGFILPRSWRIRGRPYRMRSPMSSDPRVFVSATTRDLGSFRKAVADVLLTLEARPVIQDHFAPDYRSVVEMLREKLGNCDAVLCLVGGRYGYEPLKRDPDQPTRSYT